MNLNFGVLLIRREKPLVACVYRVFRFVCFWGGYYESCMLFCCVLFNVMIERYAGILGLAGLEQHKARLCPVQNNG